MVRSVVLTLLLEEDGLADSAGWYLSVRGYCPGHSVAIRRDEATSAAWAAVHRVVKLIVHEPSRRWGVQRLHQRAEPAGD